MPILKLKKHDPKKELEFEVRYQLGLTTDQRFYMMWNGDSTAWIKMARKHEPNKTLLIVKRK